LAENTQVLTNSFNQDKSQEKEMIDNKPEETEALEKD
jgi:hypothetical protein